MRITFTELEESEQGLEVLGEEVAFTPHIAFNSVESIKRINAATAANITRFLSETPTGIAAASIDHKSSVKPSDELCLAQTPDRSLLNNPQPINP